MSKGPRRARAREGQGSEEGKGPRRARGRVGQGPEEGKAKGWGTSREDVAQGQSKRPSKGPVHRASPRGQSKGPVQGAGPERTFTQPVPAPLRPPSHVAVPSPPLAFSLQPFFPSRPKRVDVPCPKLRRFLSKFRPDLTQITSLSTFPMHLPLQGPPRPQRLHTSGRRSSTAAPGPRQTSSAATLTRRGHVLTQTVQAFPAYRFPHVF